MSACLEIQPGLSMNQVGTIDHYTLIVECAETVAHFHADVLGFELLEIRPLNTGSAEPGCHDMLNYIMRAPDGSGRTIVITEGLTDQSFFRKHFASTARGSTMWRIRSTLSRMRWRRCVREAQSFNPRRP